MPPVLTALLCEATIPELPPSVNHIWSQGKGRTFKPKSVVAWQDSARLYISQGRHISEPYTGKCALFITLHVRNNRRMDIDNRIKCLQDCLEPAGLVKDDSQVWLLEVGRVQELTGMAECVTMELWAIKDPNLFMETLRHRWFNKDRHTVDVEVTEPCVIAKPKRKCEPITTGKSRGGKTNVPR